MCVWISEEHHDVITLQLELSDPGGHGISLLCRLFDYFLQGGTIVEQEKLAEGCGSGSGGNPSILGS